MTNETENKVVTTFENKKIRKEWYNRVIAKVESDVLKPLITRA